MRCTAEIGLAAVEAQGERLKSFAQPGVRMIHRIFLAALLAASVLLSGCAVIAVADVAATVAVKTVGLAADATIGTARLAGRAVGAVADAAIPGGD